MDWTLAIGDRIYSSWSLRGWLLFAGFGIPVKVRTARLYTPQVQTLLAEFVPARTVPAAKAGALVVWDSLAIAETLAESYPQAGHWPADPAARALARAVCAEMHAGFRDLRGSCPMNVRHTWIGFQPSAAVLADLARIETLWTAALTAPRDGAGPWLFGRYTAADAFFAPVAMRIATYGLPVGAEAAAYVAAHLGEPQVRRWRAMGFAENFEQPSYNLDLPRGPWPGPAPRPARAVTSADPVNAACPFSGEPVATDSLAEIDGRVIGFCNPFCRDKSVADPAAWPEVMAILDA